MKPIKKGSDVVFLQPDLPLYYEGEDVYENLTVGNTYTVEESYMLCIKLEGVEGLFLKENFRVV